MHRTLEFLLVHCLLFTLINSSCISNTPCKCLVNEHSFTLLNCSHSLPNLPIFNFNLTKIVAQNALTRWPTNLCKYSHIEILDLSGSYFHLEFIDLSCLYELINLNLSYSQIKKIPNFDRNFLKNLQIIDLSKNQIEIIDGKSFRLLKNLRKLFLGNNPIKQINHFEYLLNLQNLQFINLTSTSSIIPIEKSFTINKWINLAHKWNYTQKSLIIRTNTIPLQAIFPPINQLKLIPINVMRIIFKTLENSTFITLFSTPKCNCTYLRNYQRIISFINFDEKISSLYQSSTCLMPNGFIHAPLFHHQTLVDLRCLTKKSKSLNSSCSLLDYHLFIQLFIFYLFYY